MRQSLTEKEELRRSFRVLLSTQLREESLLEYQNTILELSARVQELQNEVNRMNDSKRFSRC